MKNTKRALRRAHEERKKAAAKKRLRQWNPWATKAPVEPDARRIGMHAATPAACSCFMCTEWRKYDRSAARREERRERDLDC